MQKISAEGKLCLLFRHPRPRPKIRHDTDIMHLLAPSILGICLCLVCLCASSWAWFTADQRTNLAPIQAATFTVDVIPIDANGNELTQGLTKTLSDNNTSVFTLDKSAGVTAYKFRITLTGTASTGYCRIIINDDEGDDIKAYTEQLFLGSDAFEFTYYPSSNDKAIKIAPCWGTLVNTNNGIGKLTNGGSIGTQPNTSETVDTPTAEQ